MPYCNHNDHYAPLVLRERPVACRRALDVGCGDGRLAAVLASTGVPEVVGIDIDGASIELARARVQGDGRVRLIHGDLLTHDFGGERFDFVTAVASLHHVPLEPALTTMARLLRPGGRLAVLGLHRSSGIVDVAFDVAAVPVNAWHARRRSEPSQAPARPPVLSIGAVRTIAARALPGSRLRRLLLWRHLLTWTAPLT